MMEMDIQEASIFFGETQNHLSLPITGLHTHFLIPKEITGIFQMQQLQPLPPTML